MAGARWFVAAVVAGMLMGAGGAARGAADEEIKARIAAERAQQAALRNEAEKRKAAEAAAAAKAEAAVANLQDAVEELNAFEAAEGIGLEVLKGDWAPVIEGAGSQPALPAKAAATNRAANQPEIHTQVVMTIAIGRTSTAPATAPATRAAELRKLQDEVKALEEAVGSHGEPSKEQIARWAARISATAPATGAATATAPATRPAARVDAQSPNAVWALRVEGALQGRDGVARHMTVLYQRKAGKWVAAIADAPQFNRSVHEVSFDEDDAGEPLPPTCTVTIIPDAWVPADGEGYELTIVPRTRAKGQALTGHVEVRSEEAAREGVLKGEIIPDVDINNAEVNICLENLLTWGSTDQGRVEVAFERREGKHRDIFARSGLSPRAIRGEASVKMDARKVTFRDNAVGGTLVVKQNNGAGEEVTATVRLKGVRVGPVMGGTYGGTVGDEEVDGRWRGYVYELEEQADAATQGGGVKVQVVPKGQELSDGVGPGTRPAGRLLPPARGASNPGNNGGAVLEIK